MVLGRSDERHLAPRASSLHAPRTALAGAWPLDGVACPTFDTLPTLAGHRSPALPVRAASATCRNTECPDFAKSDANGGTCLGHFARDTTPPPDPVTGPSSVERGPASMTVAQT